MLIIRTVSSTKNLTAKRRRQRNHCDYPSFSCETSQVYEFDNEYS